MEKPNLKIENKKIIRFKTEKGSVYTYLPDGRTQRLKTATGEQLEPEAAIVFIPPLELIKEGALANYPEIFKSIENSAIYSQRLLEYIHLPGKTIRITDDKGKEIYTAKEVQEASSVLILFLDRNNPKESFYLPVAKVPKINYLTFDTTKFVGKDGNTYRSKHIGNKIVEIEYEK